MSTDNSFCSFCDLICEGVNDSLAPYCLSSNIIIACIFFLATILLVLKLKNFCHSTNTPLFHVRKYIILLGLLFCAVRTLRYILLLSGYQHFSRSLFLIDQILYYVPLSFIFGMYSCLIIFWSKTCAHYHNPAMKARCHYRLHVLAALNVTIVISLFVVPFLAVFSSMDFAFFTNFLLFIGSVVLLLLFLIEGTNVYKFLGSNPTEPSSSQYEANIVNAKLTTKLIISSSAFFLFSILFLFATSAIRMFAIKQNYPLCQMSHIGYRLCELVIIAILSKPFDNILTTSKRANTSSELPESFSESFEDFSLTPSQSKTT